MCVCVCARSPFLQEAKKKKNITYHRIKRDKKEREREKKKTTAIILCLAPIKKGSGVAWDGVGVRESDFLIRNFLCSKTNFYSFFFLLLLLSSWCCCWCYLFFYILKTHWLKLSLSLFFFSFSLVPCLIVFRLSRKTVHSVVVTVLILDVWAVCVMDFIMTK